jgi:hypothetical protein
MRDIQCKLSWGIIKCDFLLSTFASHRLINGRQCLETDRNIGEQICLTKLHDTA